VGLGAVGGAIPVHILRAEATVLHVGVTHGGVEYTDIRRRLQTVVSSLGFQLYQPEMMTETRTDVAFFNAVLQPMQVVLGLNYFHLDEDSSPKGGNPNSVQQGVPLFYGLSSPIYRWPTPALGPPGGAPASGGGRCWVTGRPPPPLDWPARLEPQSTRPHMQKRRWSLRTAVAACACAV
jgi:hypothetical protein